MTSEDYSLLKIAMSNFVLCRDCVFLDRGICTRVKSTNVKYDNGLLMCYEFDGCTFGTIREDDEK